MGDWDSSSKQKENQQWKERGRRKERKKEREGEDRKRERENQPLEVIEGPKRPLLPSLRRWALSRLDTIERREENERKE